MAQCSWQEVQLLMHWTPSMSPSLLTSHWSSCIPLQAGQHAISCRGRRQTSHCHFTSPSLPGFHKRCSCGGCSPSGGAGDKQAAYQQLVLRVQGAPSCAAAQGRQAPAADLPLEMDLPRERLLLRRRPPPSSLSSITRTYAESKGFSNLVSSSFLQGAGEMQASSVARAHSIGMAGTRDAQNATALGCCPPGPHRATLAQPCLNVNSMSLLPSLSLPTATAAHACCCASNVVDWDHTGLL